MHRSGVDSNVFAAGLAGGDGQGFGYSGRRLASSWKMRYSSIVARN